MIINLKKSIGRSLSYPEKKKKSIGVTPLLAVLHSTSMKFTSGEFSF